MLNCRTALIKQGFLDSLSSLNSRNLGAAHHRPNVHAFRGRSTKMWKETPKSKLSCLPVPLSGKVFFVCCSPGEGVAIDSRWLCRNVLCCGHSPLLRNAEHLLPIQRQKRTVDSSSQKRWQVAREYGTGELHSPEPEWDPALLVVLPVRTKNSPLGAWDGGVVRRYHCEKIL